MAFIYTKAKFIRLLDDYETDVKSSITGRYKSDYLEEVGKVIHNKLYEQKGLFTLEFEDGQRWMFERNQLQFKERKYLK